MRRNSLYASPTSNRFSISSRRVLNANKSIMRNAARPAATQSAWEPAAEELFQASHRLEVMVSVMLGAAHGSTDHLPSELLSAIRELRADVDRCQQLLGQ